MEPRVSNVKCVFIGNNFVFRTRQSTLCFLSHIHTNQAIRRVKVFSWGNSLGAVDLILGKISRGVPQGSNLEPLLCILYVNNLPNVSSMTQFPLFVADTSIFVLIMIPTTLFLLLT